MKKKNKRPVVMRVYYLLLILLFATSLTGQSLKVAGIVSSQKSKEVLKEAIVVVQAAPSTTVYTDDNGYYEIYLPKGEHLLEVYSVGMQSLAVKIELTQDTVINFEMKQLNIDLEEVEVVGDKITEGITRLKAVENFAIYESKKNEVIVLNDFAANKVSNNARQVFAKIPGLNIWESDFAGLQLDIAARGLGPSRTANFNTRQNGYDMSADALGYPESYYLPPMQAVDRIEVVRGAASLQYGSQFGGMLNFKIKEAPDKTFELTAEQAVGSFGLFNSFVSAGGRKNGFDYYSYYQYRTGTGWRDNPGCCAS